MRRKQTLFACMLGAALMAGSLPARAASASADGTTGRIAALCTAETARIGAAQGLPRGLLEAISLAETGRWDDARRESFAWPWTVTSGGEGRYYATREAALAAVETLVARGVSNIDVGCMQINLHYHGGAFENLADALDPATNVAYAAEFLKRLHGATRSWQTAAGYYHSTTPDLSRAYRAKVMRLWNRPGRTAPVRHPPEPFASPIPAFAAPPAVPIDTARTRELNQRLRKTRLANAAEDAANRRMNELAAWREARTEGRDVRYLAALRRAETEAKRRNDQAAGLERRDANAFALKRRAQLEDWRRHVAAAPAP